MELPFRGKNVYGFLERLKELQRAYSFSAHQILKGFPELPKGDAQLWYRKCSADLTSLNDLEQSLTRFYLSPNELRQLFTTDIKEIESKSATT